MLNMRELHLYSKSKCMFQISYTGVSVHYGLCKILSPGIFCTIIGHTKIRARKDI